MLITPALVVCELLPLFNVTSCAPSNLTRSLSNVTPIVRKPLPVAADAIVVLPIFNVVEIGPPDDPTATVQSV